MNQPVMREQFAPEQQANHQGWWTREHALIVVLVAVTAILLYLCWKLVQPFLTPIAWALALAVIAHPLHAWIARRLEKPGLAAGLAVALVAMVIVAPAVFVGNQLVREAAAGAKTIQAALQEGKWQEQVERTPWLKDAVHVLQQQGNMEGLQAMAADAGKRVSQAIAGSAWVVVQLLLTLFVLFFLLRDRTKALGKLRSLVPLSTRETDDVFKRVSDTIHATVFGTLTVAAVQGTLGGLMFWWLGLPAPIVWGTVMALLATIPVLGTFVIWAPTALFLAASGEWGKAVILTVWGSLIVGCIDNLLYPFLVGKRMRLHTVPVFFAILGGLTVFGACGIVLGPVILALTDAILEIWRRRTANGQPADNPPLSHQTHEPKKEALTAPSSPSGVAKAPAQ